jgi:hypothetical protein
MDLPLMARGIQICTNMRHGVLSRMFSFLPKKAVKPVTDFASEKLWTARCFIIKCLKSF